MSYNAIIELLKSNKFDNDVWSKIDYIQSKTRDYSSQELIDIYDSLD